jgi:hypothetical protein
MDAPGVCCHCRELFDERDPQRALGLLEGGNAMCSACAWLVDHPDTDVAAPRGTGHQDDPEFAA